MCHYVSQFLWVTANIVWAFGELFVINGNDLPQTMFDPSVYSWRWASSIILFCAWIPIILLYFAWIPLTYFGYIGHNRNSESDVDIVMNPIQNKQYNSIQNTKENETNEIEIKNPMQKESNLSEISL